MKRTKKLLFISTLAILVSIGYVYPQLECDRLIGFETTPRDTFGLDFDNAGDFIFTESGVDVYVDSMLWTNGNKGYFWAYIDTAQCGFGAVKTMRFNNVSLIFDISQVNTYGVSFKYWDLGGDENLQVNGGPVHVINSFRMLPPDVAPGVTCIVDSISPDNCGYSFIGKVTLNGAINELRIAGQELWIDSVCVDEIPTSLPENSYQTPEYTLEQNYPNPFSLSTEISYSIVKKSFVSLKIYDIHGREIQVLVNGHQTRNNYSVNFDAGILPDGVYYYKLQVNDFVKIRKMLLVR